MISLWFTLSLMLIIILIASQLFTNALEHVGNKLNISAGVAGSLFAAIATALPETTIPVLAVIAGTKNTLVNEQISVGAIIGSSLMLSTLSTFVMVSFVIKTRGLAGKMTPEKTGFSRDLNFFLIAFFLAAIAMYVPQHPIYLRAMISAILISLYVIYFVLTIRASKKLVASGHTIEVDEPLFLEKLGCQNTSFTMGIQLVLGLALLLFGAKGFITYVEKISSSLDVSALILSLLVIPFATEFPEKINSILWVRKNKDTLGFGNITGAMTFQGTLLPALGILLTPWQPSKPVLSGIIITIIAASWMRLMMKENGIKISSLLFNGILYLIYLYIILI
jgi:cation:H+ antiporter